jgi:hypothetical protein
MAIDLIRIRVLAAASIDARNMAIAAAQIVGGELDFECAVRSLKHGDDWTVQRGINFGAGPPTDFDLGKDGKCHLFFRPKGNLRIIVDGEEFEELPPYSKT